MTFKLDLRGKQRKSFLGWETACAEAWETDHQQGFRETSHKRVKFLVGAGKKFHLENLARSRSWGALNAPFQCLERVH